jgi:hypothetical protein
LADRGIGGMIAQPVAASVSQPATRNPRPSIPEPRATNHDPRASRRAPRASSLQPPACLISAVLPYLSSSSRRPARASKLVSRAAAALRAQLDVQRLLR